MAQFKIPKAYLKVGRGDTRLWKPDVKGKFSVKSFFKDLNVTFNREEDWKSFWNSLVPPQVLVFC